LETVVNNAHGLDSTLITEAKCRGLWTSVQSTSDIDILRENSTTKAGCIPPGRLVTVAVKAWLEGHEFDLEDLATLLPTGDTRVIKEGDGYT
jgi:hypothetical protein